jgi:hypothetical protein
VGQMTATKSMAHNLKQCQVLVSKAVAAGAKVSPRFIPKKLIDDEGRLYFSQRLAIILPRLVKRQLHSSNLSKIASLFAVSRRKLVERSCQFMLESMSQDKTKEGQEHALVDQRIWRDRPTISKDSPLRCGD